MSDGVATPAQIVTQGALNLKTCSRDATILIILMGDIAWLGVYLGVYLKIEKAKLRNGGTHSDLFG